MAAAALRGQNLTFDTLYKQAGRARKLSSAPARADCKRLNFVESHTKGWVGGGEAKLNECTEPSERFRLCVVVGLSMVGYLMRYRVFNDTYL